MTGITDAGTSRSRRSGRPADPARLAAVRVLFAVLEEKAYSNLSSMQMLEREDLDATRRSFASALIYGTLSRAYSIDWILGQVSRQPVAELDPWVRTILRLGVWQLYWARHIPVHAAVDESVHLARQLARPWAASYVNAVLRQASRRQIELPRHNEPVYYSIPPELYGYLRKACGDAEAADLASAFLDDHVKIGARVNLLRTDPARLMLTLADEAVIAEPGLYCAEALRLDVQGHALPTIRAWQDGCFSVQDESAMLVGHAAEPKPGQRIIDLCAAPGGKTCHLAEMTGGQAEILAFDQNPGRLRLVAENAARLGLAGIECRLGDATGSGMDPALADSADLVLADVPCSGLGLLRRKPEIRLTMNHERITGLYPVQAAILAYAATLVRPGGSLVYSTCTVNPAENIEQVRTFLEKQDGRFELDPLSGRLPAALLAKPDLAATAVAGWIQLLPHRHGVDGFFMARLRKVRT